MNNTGRFFQKHKVRFERGRHWYATLQVIINPVLIAIFVSKTDIRYKILSGVSVFVLIYLMGYLDDILKLIDLEQDGFAKRNPVFMEIIDRLKNIQAKLK